LNDKKVFSSLTNLELRTFKINKRTGRLERRRSMPGVKTRAPSAAMLYANVHKGKAPSGAEDPDEWRSERQRELCLEFKRLPAAAQQPYITDAEDRKLEVQAANRRRGPMPEPRAQKRERGGPWGMHDQMFPLAVSTITKMMVSKGVQITKHYMGGLRRVAAKILTEKDHLVPATGVSVSARDIPKPCSFSHPGFCRRRDAPVKDVYKEILYHLKEVSEAKLIRVTVTPLQKDPEEKDSEEAEGSEPPKPASWIDVVKCEGEGEGSGAKVKMFVSHLFISIALSGEQSLVLCRSQKGAPRGLDQHPVYLEFRTTTAPLLLPKGETGEWCGELTNNEVATELAWLCHDLSRQARVPRWPRMKVEILDHDVCRRVARSSAKTSVLEASLRSRRCR